MISAFIRNIVGLSKSQGHRVHAIHAASPICTPDRRDRPIAPIGVGRMPNNATEISVGAVGACGGSEPNQILNLIFGSNQSAISIKRGGEVLIEVQLGVRFIWKGNWRRIYSTARHSFVRGMDHPGPPPASCLVKSISRLHTAPII